MSLELVGTKGMENNLQSVTWRQNLNSAKEDCMGDCIGDDYRAC